MNAKDLEIQELAKLLDDMPATASYPEFSKMVDDFMTQKGHDINTDEGARTQAILLSQASAVFIKKVLDNASIWLVDDEKLKADDVTTH